MEIEDHRSDINTHRHIYCYVVATDRQLSGWGRALHRSLYAVAVNDSIQAETVLNNMRNNDRFKYPRTLARMDQYGRPYTNFHSEDHLKIVDFYSASYWFY